MKVEEPQKVLLRNLKDTQLSEGASTWITFLFVSLGLLKGASRNRRSCQLRPQRVEEREEAVHINVEETLRKETAGQCVAGQAHKQI